MFDPASMVKYAQTPASVLESAEHKAHALKNGATVDGIAQK